MDENPYSSPSDNLHASYSHRLFWVFCRSLLVCVAIVFIADVVLLALGRAAASVG